jgi:Ca2+-transporting ATPase
VRRLASVEALGSATVICTDKTGTLTLGEMRVGTVVAGGRRLELSDGALCEQGRAVRPAGVDGLPELLRAAVLCNNASLGPSPTGDPTERALLHLAATLGIDRQATQAAYARAGEIPFSSDRKRMATLHRADGALVAYVKGAPDAVLARCTSVFAADGPRQLSQSERARLEHELEELAAGGLRVLALGMRTLAGPADALVGRPDEVERDLTLLGMVGLVDPPRPEVSAALAAARAAGIRTIMITGDHPATASAIGHRLGIADGHVVTGAELERLGPRGASDERAVASVYARVAPQQKLEIVRSLQERDEVVAMTGDGANDAPALRLADVGVAMGIRGTPVSKEAADIVLADDHYATIVAAVEEGRAIYGNLRKAVLYLVSGNLGEILVILMAMLVGSPLPLQAVQILWINVLTDALPALGLGMEPPEPGVMTRPPRRPGEPFLPRWTVPLIAVPEPDNLAAAQTAAFVTLVLAHLGIAWAQRATLASSLALPLRSNPMLALSVLVGAGLLLLLLYTGPGRTLFHTYPLDLTAWTIALALTPLPFLGSEAAKALVRRVHTT